MARSKIVLDEVFTEDDSTFLSVTSHSGEIASILAALGHRSFGLSTGQIIPVLVKAQKQYQAYPTATIQAWTSLATCTSSNHQSGGQGMRLFIHWNSRCPYLGSLDVAKVARRERGAQVRLGDMNHLWKGP